MASKKIGNHHSRQLYCRYILSWNKTGSRLKFHTFNLASTEAFLRASLRRYCSTLSSWSGRWSIPATLCTAVATASFPVSSILMWIPTMQSSSCLKIHWRNRIIKYLESHFISDRIYKMHRPNNLLATDHMHLNSCTGLIVCYACSIPSRDKHIMNKQLIAHFNCSILNLLSHCTVVLFTLSEDSPSIWECHGSIGLGHWLWNFSGVKHPKQVSGPPTQPPGSHH